MQGRMTIIKPDRTVVVKDYNAPAPYEDMSAAVEGYIELIPGFEVFEGLACVAFANEEGKLRHQAVNTKATAHWIDALGYIPGDLLVGPVAIFTGDQQFMGAL